MSELAKTIEFKKDLVRKSLQSFPAVIQHISDSLNEAKRTPLLKALNALLQHCKSHSLPFLKRLITITMVPEIFLWNAMI